MPCSGTAWICGSHEDEGMCYICGCYWSVFCKGFASACSTHDENESNCVNCGCDWTPPGKNMKINIGDVWKDVSEIKINISDVWRDVTEIWINIGDVWKQVF